MKLINYYYCILIILLQIFCKLINAKSERARRFLIVPPTSPTRHQLIVGIGIPLPDLHKESVTTGYVIKAQYYLPVKPDDWRPALYFQRNVRDLSSSINENNFDNNSFGIDQMTGEKYERYNVEAIDIETKLLSDNEIGNDEEDDEEEEDEDDEDDGDSFIPWTEPEAEDVKPVKIENTRWNLYKGLEAISKSNGFEGRPCVLRTICEAADATFTHKSGILGELLNVILTPSTTDESLSHYTDNEYLKAEQLGKSGGPCDKIFNECNNSLLDLISNIDPISYLTKLI